MIINNKVDALLHQYESNEVACKYNQCKPVLDESEDSSDGNEPVLTMKAGYSETFPYTPHPSLSLFKTTRYTYCPIHVHSWIELGYMYSGSITHSIGGVTHTLEKGQIYILDSDTPHKIGYAGEEDLLIAFIMQKSFFVDSFFNRFSVSSMLSQFLINAISHQSNHDNYITFHSEYSYRIQYIMNELMMEHIEPSSNSYDIINSLISLLFLELVNIYEQNPGVHNLKLSKSNIIPILKYIETNFKICNLKNTAECFNLNPNYLTTLLKYTTGHSFKSLVQQQRLSYITNLLINTNQSIEEIAHNAGYETTTYFYRKFKDAYGCSPNEYRNRDNNKNKI
jgi:AraC-like DNA-binding protein